MSNRYYRPSQQMEQLQALLRSLPKCEGVLPLNCEVAGFPNFFPGGRGHKGSEFPTAPVMFIGHNFDTDQGFWRSVARGAEDPKMPTWRNLREHFLRSAEIAEERCFFTNLYLGAMVHPLAKPGEQQKTTNVGAFRCTREYHRACVTALRRQVEIVGPKVIALLGNKVPPAFGEAFPCYAEFCAQTISVTQARQPLCGYNLQLTPQFSVQVIALLHPSNPRSVESHRRQGMLLRAASDAAGGAY